LPCRFEKQQTDFLLFLLFSGVGIETQTRISRALHAEPSARDALIVLREQGVIDDIDLGRPPGPAAAARS
jgi:hypothetical protein